MVSALFIFLFLTAIRLLGSKGRLVPILESILLLEKHPLAFAFVTFFLGIGIEPSTQVTLIGVRTLILASTGIVTSTHAR